MNFASSRAPNLGLLGEKLVAQWLQSQNWLILHHRWRCRWGEIDLIAQLGEIGRGGDGEADGVGGAGGAGGDEEKRRLPNPQYPIPNTQSPQSILAFVEVKTRSQRNWDADGLLAITPAKQAKLWQSATLFLAQRPDLGNLPCRFDVAVVNSMRLSQTLGSSDSSTAKSHLIEFTTVQLGQPVLVGGYQLILQDYIVSAFDIQES